MPDYFNTVEELCDSGKASYSTIHPKCPTSYTVNTVACIIRHSSSSSSFLPTRVSSPNLLQAVLSTATSHAKTVTASMSCGSIPPRPRAECVWPVLGCVKEQGADFELVETCPTLCRSGHFANCTLLVSTSFLLLWIVYFPKAHLLNRFMLCGFGLGLMTHFRPRRVVASSVCNSSQLLVSRSSIDPPHTSTKFVCVACLLDFPPPTFPTEGHIKLPIARGPLPHATGPRQGLNNSYHSAHISASPMPPVICASNYPRQNHSTSYQTPISSEERAPAAPIPARRQFSNHHYHLPPNPPLQRLRSPPPPSQHQQQQQPFPPLPMHQSQSHFTIQMPSSRGTAFKKLNNTAAPPPYDSLRSVIGNPANQRTHHATGPPLPVYFSPSLTASPTPQMRNRNATPNVGTPVGGAILPGAKKTSPLPSTRLQHQRPEVLSPMYQTAAKLTLNGDHDETAAGEVEE
ncbi:hypothetical protein EGR_06123 [Echinococcus granulosus]|uniref:Uncharacterized protein n=1 Tax=Echinococcus granulosus TaxID=6210 RepID=W6ULL3_ECHGR|nr:hypothetical protein EGR_06123 [Echinococcus granulosus]EUB59007.1 hypothetical protein EGR_06123 [Echinococcus granulosus]